MKKILFFLLCVAPLAFLGGCNRSDDLPASLPTSSAEVKQDAAKARLDLDLKRLQAFSLALKELEKEMVALQKAVKLKERGYYTSDEHDKIENLLFRYLVCRESLWEIIDYYRDYQSHFTDKENQAKGFIMAFDAALHLAYYTSSLVSAFIDEDKVIKKLNEPYHRTDIPRGTYDKLFASVTSIENIEALKTAWELFTNELVDLDSALSKVAITEPAYRDSVKQITDLYGKVDIKIKYILEERSLLLPDVRNRLRQTAIVALAKKAKDVCDDNLYAARGILFVNVSRLKSPIDGNIAFSKEQIAKMRAMMQPGDIILTFSSGYMSNVFLPGKFKHGITYVGLPDQRRKAGVPSRTLKGVPLDKVSKLYKDVKVEKLPSGEQADLIEAVAEGVIFNSLEKITDQHIARLCVLRPRVNGRDLGSDLTTVFLLLGNTYDFKFDFTDGTHQCCTEVVYRALHNKGPIEFELVDRMGIQTLAADDIISYYLSSEKKPFEFVLLAEENKGSKGNKAKILTGDEGKNRLRELMEDD